ncbi:hypothetical protein P152DRAFT_471858 [Eremomyces bilateralis CBS 781.70]|uniref:GATA-type domain-containing protein n=1 Tax=Eremomyces bilateralis CBS 781.70 TaxID=1392243 RepID=A0A6G1GB30_9PEZI|nr:uncharacterized protein P152DRAFT_471858 [Eremomyces bilateralis CBS 781.70]KAF1815243.1 hypothetical protein P152DRAFT_471858 [Eremomyces bilateralis CBS 781.70]
MVSPTFPFLGAARMGSIGGPSGTVPVGHHAMAGTPSSQSPFASSTPTAAATTFSFTYPNDPSMTGHNGLISPPGSRRTSGDDKDQRKAPATAPQRQSLPSIHEALRSDPVSPFAVQPPSNASPRGHNAYPQPVPPQSVTASGPTDPFKKSYPSESMPGSSSTPHLQHPQTSSSSTSFLSKPPQPIHAPQPPPNPPDQIPSFSNIPSSSHNSKFSLHPPNTTSTVSSPNATRPMPFPPYPATHSHSQLPSPGFDHSPHPPQSASTVPPPPPQPSTPFAYHSQFPPPYPYSQQPHQTQQPGSSQPGQQPGGATASGFPPAPPMPFAGPPRPGTETYGANIKRHLESFDFESSLNEIAEGSGQILDFAKHFGQRPPPPAPHGMPPHHRSSIALPSPTDVDTLLQKGQRVQEALMRIREFALNQQAIAEQEHEARFKGNGMFAGGAVGGAMDRYEYDVDTKGGGAGGYPPDAKKRRGRAAPPGRCHSCNRAETPEWRRGPDGARTLCNACGLHYAKLTRKMGANNKTAIGSSNLRPKSIGPSSPPQPGSHDTASPDLHPARI